METKETIIVVPDNSGTFSKEQLEEILEEIRKLPPEFFQEFFSNENENK